MVRLDVRHDRHVRAIDDEAAVALIGDDEASPTRAALVPGRDLGTGGERRVGPGRMQRRRPSGGRRHRSHRRRPPPAVPLRAPRDPWDRCSTRAPFAGGELDVVADRRGDDDGVAIDVLGVVADVHPRPRRLESRRVAESASDPLTGTPAAGMSRATPTCRPRRWR